MNALAGPFVFHSTIMDPSKSQIFPKLKLLVLSSTFLFSIHFCTVMLSFSNLSLHFISYSNCMAMLCSANLHPKLTFPTSSFPPKISTNCVDNKLTITYSTPSSAASLKMEDDGTGKQKLMEFPHLCGPHRDAMVGLIEALEAEQEEHLGSCAVPPELQYYQNESGSNQGTLHIRSGLPSTHIDFILASWLHLKTPNGGALNITNLAGYLKSTTDAPNFQFELVQCSPEYLILFLDIIPRKDLVLHPDYLKTFYEDNKLEQLRQKLDQVPEISPYFSSSLYFRRVVSPTGILVSIKCQGPERAEEILRDHVIPVSDEVMKIWLEKCVVGEREVSEDEKVVMEKRDRLIKSKAIEMDLSNNMPLQFGQQLADRVLGVIRRVFNAT